MQTARVERGCPYPDTTAKSAVDGTHFMPPTSQSINVIILFFKP